jgi:hypothetical protein
VADQVDLGIDAADIPKRLRTPDQQEAYSAAKKSEFL